MPRVEDEVGINPDVSRWRYQGRASAVGKQIKLYGPVEENLKTFLFWVGDDDRYVVIVVCCS